MIRELETSLIVEVPSDVPIKQIDIQKNLFLCSNFSLLKCAILNQISRAIIFFELNNNILALLVRF